MKRQNIKRPIYTTQKYCINFALFKKWLSIDLCTSVCLNDIVIDVFERRTSKQVCSIVRSLTFDLFKSPRFIFQKRINHSKATSRSLFVGCTRTPPIKNKMKRIFVRIGKKQILFRLFLSGEVFRKA